MSLFESRLSERNLFFNCAVTFACYILCSVFGATQIKFVGSGNGEEIIYYQLAQTVVATTGITDHAHVSEVPE